jgi:(p)ppGpp synthase/HD superfamily hydrolase
MTDTAFRLPMFDGQPPAIVLPPGYTSSKIVRDAAKLAHDAHWRTARDDGSSYFEHVQRVAHTVARSKFATTSSVAAAYLHDAIEDTAVTALAIATLCGQEVADIVKMVTRSKSEDYFYDYIDRCALALESFAIKAADLSDNLSTLAPGDRRMKKYVSAMERLHARRLVLR